MITDRVSDIPVRNHYDCDIDILSGDVNIDMSFTQFEGKAFIKETAEKELKKMISILDKLKKENNK
jgi:hypothetical protein